MFMDEYDLSLALNQYLEDVVSTPSGFLSFEDAVKGFKQDRSYGYKTSSWGVDLAKRLFEIHSAHDDNTEV